MTQRGMVQKLSPVRTELIPPKGAVPAGFTHDGRHQLFRLSRKMNRPVPYIEADKSDRCGNDHKWTNDRVERPECEVCGVVGERLYTTHAQTGEKIVARNKPRVVVEEKIFFLQDCGNCNIEMVDYAPPSPEEIAAEERKKRIKEMDGTLAQVLVDGGVTPDRLMDALKGPGEPSVTTDSALNEPIEAHWVADTEETFDSEGAEMAPLPKQYPVADKAGPWWTLSNGSRVRGEKAAQEAEAAVQVELERVKEDAAVAAEGSF